jgi:hypothetical protein
MPYRILSLDGGGSWALIQVLALTALYDSKTTGHSVLQDFDLVAANSGGSIVLGGLVEDLSLGDLLGYFCDQAKRQAIFSPTKSWGDRALHDLTGLGPKYSADAKLVALQRLLPKRGPLKLTDAASGLRRIGSQSDVHLLITSFDYDSNRAKFFRSAPASAPSWGEGAASTVTLADAIHASTNAPVNYFDAPARFPDSPGRYWDGAITGCNNPVVAGVTEAIVLGQKPADIVALSIGTATVVLPKPTPGQPASPLLASPPDQGLINDLRKLAGSIVDDPPDIATFLAHVMSGGALTPPDGHGNGRVVRMNPMVSPVRALGGLWKAPGTMTLAQFGHLAGLDMDAVAQPEVDAIADYAQLWLQSAAPNQPIRMNADDLTLEVGHAWFQDALAWWKKIK